MKRNILIILLIVIVFFLVMLAMSKKKLLPVSSAVNSQHIPIQKTAENTYSFSMWYNISPHKSARNVHLLDWRGHDSSHHNIFSSNKQHCNNINSSKLKLVIDKVYSQLKVFVDQPHGDKHPIIINNVPLGGWNNIIVSVNNNYIDVYINGDLVESKPVMLKNVLGCHLRVGGFHGFIGNLLFSTNALSIQRVKEIYYSGLGENPISNLLNRYRVELVVNNQPHPKNFQL